MDPASHHTQLDDDDSVESTISFADLGIQRVVHVKHTVFGPIRVLNDLSRWEILFWIVSIVGILASIGLNSEKIVHPTNDTDLHFAILLLVNSVFGFWYIFDGVLREQPYEIILFAGSCLTLLGYVLLNYFHLDNTYTCNDIRFGATAILTPITVLLALKVTVRYCVSGNLVFRTVGGDPRLQKMCRRLFLAQSLFVFDVQFLISMVLLFRSVPTKFELADALVLGIGLPFCVLWLTIGYLTMRFESRKMLPIIVCLWFVEPVYAAWTFYKHAHFKNTTIAVLDVITFVTGGLAVISHILLLVVFIVVYRNFGKGLNSRVYTVPLPGFIQQPAVEEEEDTTDERDTISILKQ